MRASGLLLDVVHSSETVSLTRASLGPVTVTVLGPTEVYIIHKFIKVYMDITTMQCGASFVLRPPPSSMYKITHKGDNIPGKKLLSPRRRKQQLRTSGLREDCQVGDLY